MTTLPYETLTYIQNGEPVSGGTGGNSDGVLNRPLTQLLSNVDAVRDALDPALTEISNARGGQVNLDTRLDNIEDSVTDIELSNIYTLETLAATNRQRLPSCFIWDRVDVAQATTTYNETTAGSGAYPFWMFSTQTLAAASSGMANRICFEGTPKPFYVDGYPIYLNTYPSKLMKSLVTFPAPPTTGTRLDFAFVEVWKEKIVRGAADDVLFPYGNVMFGDSGTFDSCTLYNTNASGGNNPAYLAASGNHGYYIKANDANLASFLANPHNNVVCGPDGSYYQIRWRIRTVGGVASANVLLAHQDTTNIKAQGMLASPSAYSFAVGSNDPTLSVATHSTLSKDSVVRAVPLALVHRRNTTAWSLNNPNGAGAIGGTSGRPDGLFSNHIEQRDMLDLRPFGQFDDNLNYKEVFERSLDLVQSSSLTTSFEQLTSDSDGNESYKELGIYGTRLLRMDGLAGTYAFDAQNEVIWKKKAENGITSKLDGIRNYFSDIGGDQSIKAFIPRIDQDGVSPTLCFTYVSSTKTLTLDASDIDSGLDNNAGSNRTLISHRTPILKWAIPNPYGAPWEGAQRVAGAWSNLGTDAASFAISQTTKALLQIADPTVFPTVGAVYKDANNVEFTIDTAFYDLSAGYGVSRCGISFAGTPPCEHGTYTKVSGTGDASLTPKHAYTGYLHTTATPVGVKGGDTYTGPDAVTYTVYRVIPHLNLIRFVRNSGYGNQPSLGTFTRVSGSGNSTLISDASYVGNVGYAYNPLNDGQDIVGVGYGVMPSTAGIHVQAYVSFFPGSGILTHIPRATNYSFMGCHFNVNISGTPTQVLPGSGVDFIPFGLTANPVDDGNLPVDSKTRTTSLMGFLYKGTCIDINTAPSDYNAKTSTNPCVIKDGSTYKMWFSGLHTDGVTSRILYTTSTDGNVWTTPQLAMDKDTEPNGYNSSGSSNPCVIKDGSTYKMWFAGYTSSVYRILYATSSDGITWSAPQAAVNPFNEPNGFDSPWAYYPWVIKDGSTYKMWYTGNNNSNVRILYTTSADGITWEPSRLALDHNTEPNGLNSYHSHTPCVIKDGSTYKMWFSGYSDTYRILYATSSDGITWSAPQLVVNPGAQPWGADSHRVFSCSVLKDGARYEMWYGAYNNVNYRILHAILTMTDSANTGSSLVGVYATEGTMQHAPPANSQVVIMYESCADQLNRTLIGVSTARKFIYHPGYAFAYTAGTGAKHLADTRQDTTFFTNLAANSSNKPYDFNWRPVNSQVNDILAGEYRRDASSEFANLSAGIVRFPVYLCPGYVNTYATATAAAYNTRAGIARTVSNGHFGSISEAVPLGFDPELTSVTGIVGFALASYANVLHITAHDASINSGAINGYTKPLVAIGRPVVKF